MQFLLPLLFLFFYLVFKLNFHVISSQPAISVGSVTSLDPSQTVLNCSGTGNSLCKIKGILLHLAAWILVYFFHFEYVGVFLFFFPILFSTHIIVLPFWYQDVHLGAFGADYVTVQSLFTQVHLAALRLVNGNSGNRSQHLQKNPQNRSFRTCWPCKRSVKHFFCVCCLPVTEQRWSWLSLQFQQHSQKLDPASYSYLRREKAFSLSI